MPEITKEYLENKLEEANKLLQNRVDIINQYSVTLEQAKAERIQLMGQIQRIQEDLKYLSGLKEE